LADALPALEAARIALEDLEKSDVTEIRYVPSAFKAVTIQLCCVFCFVCLHPVSVYCELNHDIVYALLNKYHTKIQGLSWSWLYDAINAYHNFSCEFKTRSWRGVGTCWIFI
jgi:hypothetical protein